MNMVIFAEIIEYNHLDVNNVRKNVVKSMKRSLIKPGGKASSARALARSEEVITQSELLKALAHPVRLSMMRLLNDAQKTDSMLCANDIEKFFDLSQPTISHHLKILREAKLVKTQQQGTWVYFSLYAPTVTAAYELIKGLIE